MTPANRVTTVRAIGAVVCAWIVGRSWIEPTAYPPLSLPLVAGPTLLLDLADGKVARLTGSVTHFGARFDMEVDAAMIAVLSVHAAAVSPIALLVGASRYLFACGARLRPVWRTPVPPRPGRKVIAACVAALMWLTTVPVAPTELVWGCVLISAALLAWSFGTQVLEVEQLAGESGRERRIGAGHVR